MNNEIRYVTRFDEDYPKRLLNIPDSPAGLYIKGELPQEDKPTVAIIGSRICSEYGKAVAAEFAAVLAKSGVAVISGMAKGVDGIAQLSAVNAGGKTYGVLGCGVNVIYPRQNEALYKKVIMSGGLISEYLPDQKAYPSQFPERNRIISGLADIILVVEAKKRSGTSITVNRALEQGKDIYAIPGRVHDICSEGCNELIAQGAGIAISPDTILAALNINSETDNKNAGIKSQLSPEEISVYELLDFEPKSVTHLSALINISLSELFEILFNLQLKGLITDIGQNLFVKRF